MKNKNCLFDPSHHTEVRISIISDAETVPSLIEFANSKTSALRELRKIKKSSA